MCGYCRHALPDTRDQAQPKCNHETERQCQWLGGAGQGWEPEVLTVGGNSVMVDTAIMLGASGYLGWPPATATRPGHRRQEFPFPVASWREGACVLGDGSYTVSVSRHSLLISMAHRVDVMPDVSPVSVLSWSSVASCFTELE